jgi:mono/diheme cytochrome c family protein
VVRQVTAEIAVLVSNKSHRLLDLRFSDNARRKMLQKIAPKHGISAMAVFVICLFAWPYTAAAQSDGQKLYGANCEKCHGPDGSGGTVVGKAVGAKDLRAAEARKLTDAEIFTQIDQGKGNMPPFGGTLSKAQINSLIPFVRQFSKKAAAPVKKAG